MPASLLFFMTAMVQSPRWEGEGPRTGPETGGGSPSGEAVNDQLMN
jgi:hypothetical protein